MNIEKKKQLRELINKFLTEYTGTGASGGNAGDGNSITSPRPFPPGEEMENYIMKNVYGGEGGQWVGDKVGSNPNRHPNVRFESLKKYIKDLLEEISSLEFYKSRCQESKNDLAGIQAKKDNALDELEAINNEIDSMVKESNEKISYYEDRYDDLEEDLASNPNYWKGNVNKDYTSTHYSGYGSKCKVEIISRTDLLRAHGYKT